MPIRFRCAYCNQLMGIARRKAGTVVKCPNCNGQVVVPVEDGGPEGGGTEPQSPAPAQQPLATQQPLFERSDFDEVLNTGGKRGVPPPVPQVPAAPAPYPPSFPPVPVPMPPPKVTGKMGGGEQLDFPANLAFPAAPPGIVLSPAMATLLSVAVVVALALAFTAGLVVGRILLQPSPREEPRDSLHYRSAPSVLL